MSTCSDFRVFVEIFFSVFSINIAMNGLLIDFLTHCASVDVMRCFTFVHRFCGRKFGKIQVL